MLHCLSLMLYSVIDQLINEYTLCEAITISGHADNLAKAQKANVKFIIRRLPVIEHMMEIARAMGNGFKLFDGLSAETSGGLLIAVPKEKVLQLFFELPATEFLCFC